MQDRSTKWRWGLRLGAMIQWVVILGLGLALVAERERAREREALLRSALRAARNSTHEAIRAELEKPVDMPFAGGTTLSGLVSHVKNSTGWVATNRWYTKQVFIRMEPLASGIPVFVDPVGLQEVGVSMQTPIKVSSTGVPLKTSLRAVLEPLNLGYTIRSGLLVITTKEEADASAQDDRSLADEIP